MTKDYPVVVRGPLYDLGDLLNIARVEGKKILKQRVRVKPLIFPLGNDYIVMVEPDGSGCSKVSAVGDREKSER